MEKPIKSLSSNNLYAINLLMILRLLLNKLTSFVALSDLTKITNHIQLIQFSQGAGVSGIDSLPSHTATVSD
jgi:hypothetical protein